MSAGVKILWALPALLLIAAAPSPLRAAAAPPQVTQPGTNFPGGSPRGNSPPYNPAATYPNTNNSRPTGDNPQTTSGQNQGETQTTNPTLPRENDPPSQGTQRLTPTLDPFQRYGDDPTIRDERRTNRGSDLPFPPSLDPQLRARGLSAPPPPFAPGEPPVVGTPQNPDLRNRIERLGTTIPDAPDVTPQLNPAGGRGSPPSNPPLARVIRPPVALPARRPGSGVPPAAERRFVATEVVVEVSAATPAPAIAAMEQRNRLTRLDQLNSQLSGTALLRERIDDGRGVAAVVRALENDAAVMSAQPNYLFALQQNGVAREYDSTLQYALAKLRLTEAHQLAMGENVLVGMIDSGVDVSHPELEGAIAKTYDTLGSGAPHGHGTAIAGLIVAHAKLMGAAPSARILAVRAFDTAGPNAQGLTFNVLKGLDWTAVNGARVINMSFAGPSDPSIHRSLEGAFRNGIVLVAAAGNSGPKSPPLYPAADPSVIAVMATDADDKYFAASNRGRHITIAAPGVDILAPAPGGRYEVSSGTSFSAAEVSGIAALLLQRKPDLTPDGVRRTLLATGRALPAQGRGLPFGARLPDAYQAISTERVLPVAVR
jgi:hypothetical protein